MVWLSHRPAFARRKLVLLAWGAALIACLLCVHVSAAGASWTTTFSEEFNGTGLNTSVWTPGWQETGTATGPVSGQCFSNANVAEEKGFLYTRLTSNSTTCHGTASATTGGLVESNPSDKSGHAGYSYLYGSVEFRAFVPGAATYGPKKEACPSGGCLTNDPALWSYSLGTGSEGLGEIENDTLEGLGEKGQACGTLLNHTEKTQERSCATGGYGGWHTYASDWQPGSVTYYHDGNLVGQANPAHLSRLPQYLIMGIGRGTTQPGISPNKKGEEGELDVQWVKVSQHTGGLWNYAGGSGSNLSLGMVEGTSPSYGPNGEIAFQANSGRLWKYVPGFGGVNYNLAMAPGTSPSMGPSGQIAFQGAEGNLWELINGTATNLKYGMLPGTSPSFGPNGEIAFVANNDALWRYVPGTGALNLNLQVSLGTSPSFASNGEIAFIKGNELWRWTSGGGGQALALGTKQGTSPSAGPNGEIAIQANTGVLWKYVPGYGGVNTTLGMAPDTNPSFCPNGEIAFQANSGVLWKYVPGYGGVNTTLGLVAGSSPSFSSGGAIAFNANM